MDNMDTKIKKIKVLTFTHNRKNIFLMNFKKNIKKLKSKKHDIVVDYYINCDDGSINKSMLPKVTDENINIIFTNDNHNPFYKRYLNFLKLNNDKYNIFIVVEDDDCLIMNIDDIIENTNLENKEIYLFKYTSSNKNINSKLKHKSYNIFDEFQLGQIVLKFSRINYYSSFINYLKLKKIKLNKEKIIMLDEIFFEFLLKNYRNKVTEVNKILFFQGVFGDNMSINYLIRPNHE